MRRCLTAWLLLLPFLGCEDNEVAVRKADLDKDGEAEVVVENAYLRMTAFLPHTKREEKYATRFIWGGWISDVIYKPAGLTTTVGKYLPPRNTDWPDPFNFGLPDQFEKTLPLEETDQLRRELLIGVGVLARRKSPDGKWSKSALETSAPWSFDVETQAGGVKALRFAQDMPVQSGYGYRLRRTILVAPNSSSFHIETSLRNTGEKAMDTDWYLHPFFAFGCYEGCWQEIPLSLGPGQPVRRESFLMPIMAPKGTVWGWLTPMEMDGKQWYATGCGTKGLFFATRWDFPLLRLRNWLSGRTYAIEPFTKIDLPPGQEKTWGMDFVMGSGMARAVDVDRHGALDLRLPEGGPWEAVFLPARRLPQGAELRVRGLNKQGAELLAEKIALPPCAPDRPAHVGLKQIALRPDVSQVSAAVLLGQEKGPEGARSVGERPLGPPNRLTGKRSLLAADPKDPMQKNAILYLTAVLAEEGMKVDQALPSELPADLKGYDVVIALGAMGLPVDRIAGYLASGGALFAAAPLDEALLRLLPISGKPESVEMKEWPKMPVQSGDPRAENIPALRVHLVKAGDHPLTQGLPFYPETDQSVARFWRVGAKPDAQVALRYSTDQSPALVVSADGRIAVLLSPVMWGEPSHWILWGAFAEYHRELMVRIVGGCCGK